MCLWEAASYLLPNQLSQRVNPIFWLCFKNYWNWNRSHLSWDSHKDMHIQRWAATGLSSGIWFTGSSHCVAWPLVWKACGSQQELRFHRIKINQSTFMLYPFQVKTLLICCGWVRQMRIVHLVIKFDHNGKVIIHTFWRENSILISFTSTQNWWTSCLIERRCKSLVP